MPRDRFDTAHDTLDILVNNAGLMATPEQQTEDGYEMQLAVNHLGHWTLTALLIPALLAAPAARVVTVTSTAHHFGRAVDPDNPHLHGAYDPWRAYGQSKLANYHFALALQREFDRAGVRAQSLLAHPGLSHSDLQTRTVREGGGGWMGRLWAWLARHTGMDVERRRHAPDPCRHRPAGQRRGVLRTPLRQLRPCRAAAATASRADEAIRRLWDVSERETGIPLTIQSA